MTFTKDMPKTEDVFKPNIAPMDIPVLEDVDEDKAEVQNYDMSDNEFVDMDEFFFTNVDEDEDVADEKVVYYLGMIMDMYVDEGDILAYSSNKSMDMDAFKDKVNTLTEALKGFEDKAKTMDDDMIKFVFTNFFVYLNKVYPKNKDMFKSKTINKFLDMDKNKEMVKKMFMTLSDSTVKNVVKIKIFTGLIKGVSKDLYKSIYEATFKDKENITLFLFLILKLFTVMDKESATDLNMFVIPYMFLVHHLDPEQDQDLWTNVFKDLHGFSDMVLEEFENAAKKVVKKRNKTKNKNVVKSKAENVNSFVSKSKSVVKSKDKTNSKTQGELLNLSKTTFTRKALTRNMFKNTDIPIKTDIEDANSGVFVSKELTEFPYMSQKVFEDMIKVSTVIKHKGQHNHEKPGAQDPGPEGTWHQLGITCEDMPGGLFEFTDLCVVLDGYTREGSSTLFMAFDETTFVYTLMNMFKSKNMNVVASETNDKAFLMRTVSCKFRTETAHIMSMNKSAMNDMTVDSTKAKVKNEGSIVGMGTFRFSIFTPYVHQDATVRRNEGNATTLNGAKVSVFLTNLVLLTKFKGKTEFLSKSMNFDKEMADNLNKIKLLSEDEDDSSSSCSSSEDESSSSSDSD